MKHVITNQIPKIAVSHNKEIKKKIFIEKGNIPNLMTFATSTFKPGHKVESHKHESMIEVFYIQSGKGMFIVNGQQFEVKEGDCITIELNENHSIQNPFDQDLVMLYFGIATD